MVTTILNECTMIIKHIVGWLSRNHICHGYIPCHYVMVHNVHTLKTTPGPTGRACRSGKGRPRRAKTLGAAPWKKATTWWSAGAPESEPRRSNIKENAMVDNSNNDGLWYLIVNGVYQLNYNWRGGHIVVVNHGRPVPYLFRVTTSIPWNGW